MFHLTHQERKVLLVISLLIAVGAALRFSGLAVKVTQMVVEDQGQILINVNTADAAGLTAIPGIGPVTAQKIIDYRSSHGSFGSLGELIKVEGIGSKKIQAMKKYITF